MRKKLIVNRLILFIAVVCLFTNCKKESNTPVPVYITLKVLEYKTEKPIAGAKVELIKCTKKFGDTCTEAALVKTLETDNNGAFIYDSNLDIDAINVSKTQYYDFSSEDLQDIYLLPYAWITLHLKN